MGASVIMGIAILLTVVTGIDYVVSAIREVRQTARLIAGTGASPPAFT